VIPSTALRPSRRRRVLIVNCYMDDTRASIGRRRKIPSAMGPVYLAGALSEDRCDLRLYSELYSGPLEDEALGKELERAFKRRKIASHTSTMIATR